MTWKERLNDITFSITTADKKKYSPLWKNGEKSKDFNISKYDFINVEGSFIDRKKSQSNSYPLLFWFQGDDHIEQCNTFETSASVSGQWTIEHPMYGTIKGQPANIHRNDSNYGITEVTITFWESISDDLPNTNISAMDEVFERVTNVNALSALSFFEGAKPSASDISVLKESTIMEASKFNPDSLSSIAYQNDVVKAIKATDKIVTNTLDSFYTLQTVLSEPANFVDSIKSKIESYVNAYDQIKSGLGTVLSKYYFESQGATIMSGMAQTAITPNDTDYVSNNDIQQINTLLLDTYNDYLETVDLQQVDVYDIDNTWSPSVDVQTALSELVFFTSQQLFLLSFKARQERSYELLKDSNLILLTHEFMGLDSLDANLETFRQLNDIRNKELYKIKKGRVIKYYV